MKREQDTFPGFCHHAATHTIVSITNNTPIFVHPCTPLRDTATIAIPAAHYDCPVSPVTKSPCVPQSPLFTNRRANQENQSVLLLSLVQEAGAKQNAKQQRATQLLGHVQRKQR